MQAPENKLVVELTKASVIGLVSTTGFIDKFATWTMAGTGATVTLLVTQMEPLLKHLTSSVYSWCLGLLLASLLAGVVSKAMSVFLEGIVSVHSKATEFASQAFANAEKSGELIDFELDVFMEKYFRDFSSCYPWPLRSYTYNKMKKSAANPLSSQRSAIRLFIVQWYAVSIQLVLLAIFILVVIYANKTIVMPG